MKGDPNKNITEFESFDNINMVYSLITNSRGGGTFETIDAKLHVPVVNENNKKANMSCLMAKAF